MVPYMYHIWYHICITYGTIYGAICGTIYGTIHGTMYGTIWARSKNRVHKNMGFGYSLAGPKMTKTGLKMGRMARNLMKLGRNPDKWIVPNSLGGVPGPLTARNGPKIKDLDRKNF